MEEIMKLKAKWEIKATVMEDCLEYFPTKNKIIKISKEVFEADGSKLNQVGLKPILMLLFDNAKMQIEVITRVCPCGRAFDA